MSSLPSDLNPASRGAIPNRKLASRNLTVANTVLYECPRSRTAQIVLLAMCNISTTKASLRLYHVTSSDTASSNNALFYDYSVDSHSTTIVDATFYMTGGDKLIAYGSAAASITVTVYGIEA